MCICDLMIKIFERHGRTGENNLRSLRPIGNRQSYREGIKHYRTFTMLYYEQDLGNGKYTSRAVRVDNERAAS